jgi:hypothetical protein
MRVNPQLVASVLCAGLAGSVFTWWVNRPSLTVITYTVATTTLGADPTVKGLLPNLKIHIGDEEVPIIHTHSLEFRVQSGPFLDSAEIAIAFPVDIRVYGKILSEAPSSLHHISCKPLTNGTHCSMSPFALGRGSFRVAMATDSKDAPTAVVLAKGVELVKAEAYLAGQTRLLSQQGPIALMVGVAFAGIVLIILLIWQILQLRTQELTILATNNSAAQEVLLRGSGKKPLITMITEDELTLRSSDRSHSRLLSTDLPVVVVEPIELIGNVESDDIDL